MNKDLQTARSNKADEFYTAYEDIQTEMSFYPDVFRNKVVYCPCDDYTVSNFYKFFRDNFHELSLKKLVSTCYSEDLSNSFYAEFDGLVEIFYVLNGNGDFASDECREIMRGSDIIVTNPPFSKFRQFISQIIEMDKHFIVLGNINAVTYREVFPHIVSKKINLGASIHAGDRNFRVPDDYPLDGTACSIDEVGNKFIRVKGVRWFSDMKFSGHYVKRTVLTERYSDGKYQKFDTYDAINVNSMKEIPVDYTGKIGVPITVLDKMNSDGIMEFVDESGNLLEFILVGMLNSGNGTRFDFAKPIVDGKCKFKRVLIRHLSMK